MQTIGEFKYPIGLRNFGGLGPEWIVLSDGSSVLLSVSCSATHLLNGNTLISPPDEREDVNIGVGVIDVSGC